MRHDILDAVVLMVAILFSFIGYNISTEANNKRIDSLESRIVYLEYELENTQTIECNTKDTIVIYLNQLKK